MAQHKTLKLSTLLMASVFSSLSYGAGFAVMEQSVTGLGRAFAGSAAVAEDASTIFFNPAGLTYLSHSQMAAGLNLISPQSDFNDEGSKTGFGAPLTGREGDAGNLAAVPNFYYAHRINDNTVAGIGVNAPFGLVTEYSDNWKGRYHAIKSDLLTININPSIAFKPSDKLSLGFGVNLQYIDLELTQAVDFGTICAGVPAACAAPQANDGKAKLTADDWSWGYNLGLIFQATEATRLALAYRSKISHHLTGDGKFTTPTNAQGVASFLNFTDASISGDVDLPESASLAVHHQVNEQWAVMADASWTRWDRFEELAISSPDPTNPLNSTKEENWDNSMRYGLGLTYAYNDKWTFRSGVAFDETPISDEYRTARIPGEDRTWVALGASYNYSETITIDAGYTHIFVSDPEINETLDAPSPALAHNLVGDYDASVDILGVQLRWTFL
ncbi:MAG: transporter [Gammaproteobacteria bacterium]|nr:MAG: transporter [Gammaproteobacteria bacterium]RKZ96683.1 MAG: transporter [Gammaproteobacteria bacterium]RKZ98569.1 MAG: transporter [Gammaproteobacteria bacterium]RLA02370.1 MAG: transporter [Gammaproteobacteria bacterium]